MIKVKRQAVLTAGRAWLGTPWRHQGRLKGQGVDCGGFICGVCQEVGLPYAYLEAYGRVPDGVQLRAIVEHVCKRVEFGQQKPGDMLLMKWSINPTHLAFLSDRGYPFSLLHSCAGARMVTEHNYDREWETRTLSYYTWPELED